MNQILTTNNDYNNNNNKLETRKIIVIFATAVILISCIIIAIAFNSIKSNKGEFTAPEIEITRQTEKEIAIKANCQDGINYIVYSWNDEKENRVNIGGSTTFERIIDIPENSINLLNIEVVTSKGIKGIKQEKLERDIDSSKPTIDEMSVTGSTLHITASDDNGLDRLVYKWEDEEERVIGANEEDNKRVTADINIKRGTYKLTIKLFDVSGNKEEVSRLITGVNQPEINVIKFGNKVRVTVTHDMGFKRIDYFINDEKYSYDENSSDYDKEKTFKEWEFPLKEGDNVVKVLAFSLEPLSNEETDDLANYSYKTFAGKCTYNP